MLRQYTLAGAAVLLMYSGSASAQMPGINDVIAQTIAGMNSGLPDSCYNGKWSPKAEKIDEPRDAALPVLTIYLETAAKGGDLSSLVWHRKSESHWALNGETVPFNQARDPIAARVTKLDRRAFFLSNLETRGRAVFDAYDSAGNALGVYDIVVRKKGSNWTISTLDIYGNGTAAKPAPLSAFCDVPGDVEKWQEAVAEREAKKAAKRAAKEAERAARAN